MPNDDKEAFFSMPEKPTERLNRVTVVETVLISNKYDPTPASYDSRYWSETGEEQPYERRMNVGESPVEIDLGWVKNPAMILIINEEGKIPSSRQPTPEEKEQAAAKVLVLNDAWRIRPSAMFKACPTNKALPLMLRSESGQIRTRIVVISKD